MRAKRKDGRPGVLQRSAGIIISLTTLLDFVNPTVGISRSSHLPPTSTMNFCVAVCKSKVCSRLGVLRQQQLS